MSHHHHHSGNTFSQGVPIGVTPTTGVPVGVAPYARPFNTTNTTSQGVPVAGHPVQPAPCLIGPAAMVPVLYNPPIPLTHFLPLGLYPGMTIYISGIPHINFNRFEIDFMRSIDGNFGEHSDNAFTFNPRRLERAVVRNTRIAGLGWQEEERHAPSFPFQGGINFDMMIRVEGNRFQVAVNGQHFIDYNHRILPLQDIKYFCISGDVTVTTVRFHTS